MDDVNKIQTQVDALIYKLSPSQATRFALSCCERLEPHYAMFAATRPDLDRTFARLLLDDLWEAVIAGGLESSSHTIAQIDAIMPDPETNTSMLVWPAILSLEGISCLLRYIQDKDLTWIRNISHLTPEIVRRYVVCFGFPTDGKFIPPALSNQAYAWVDAAPAILVELTHQLKLLERISSVNDWSVADDHNFRTFAQTAVYNPLQGEFWR